MERDAYFDQLMQPVDHTVHVPAGLLDPPAVSVLPGVRSHLQVPFAEVHGWRSLRLDLHLPDRGEGGPWPVVVYVHGGSFLTGLPGMGPWTALPAEGIAVASVTYRFAGEAVFPAAVEDVRAAVAWVRARADRYGLDPARVAIWGGSAGGYLAAMVAVTGARTLATCPRLLGVDAPAAVSALTAAVTQYAITDPGCLREDALPGTEPEVDGLLRAIQPFFGGSPTPTAVLDNIADPAGVPPFLIMHGDIDHRVGIGQGRRLHEGLEKAGVPARFVEVPGADHGAAAWADPAVVADVIAHLRGSWAASSG